MDIFAVFEQLKASLAELTIKLADAEAAIAEAKQVAYDEGFAAGVASVPTPGGEEKIYTQAELDAKVAEAVATAEAQILDLTARLEKVESKLARIKDAYAAQQVEESSGEAAVGAIINEE